MIKLKSLFRRGQGGGSSSSVASSSSKQTSQISPAHSVGIKPSASASSLEARAAGTASADLGATRKLAKAKSKDKLNDLLRVGSKEKVFDDKKELKKREKQQKMMQQAAQQHSSGDQPQPFESTANYNGIQDVSEFSDLYEDFRAFQFFLKLLKFLKLF